MFPFVCCQSFVLLCKSGVKNLMSLLSVEIAVKHLSFVENRFECGGERMCHVKILLQTLSPAFSHFKC